MKTPPKQYHVWLKERLAEAKSKNPRLSLRSFAKRLNVSPALLSQIISGKRPLSQKTAIQISKYFSLTADETNELLLSALEHRSTTHIQARPYRRAKQADFRKLQQDEFKHIANWKYFGILALANLHQNDSSPDWISKHLNISTHEAKEAFEKLESLSLVSRTQTGFMPGPKSPTIGGDVPSQAIQDFHLTTLAFASASLSSVSPKEREYGSTYFSIDKKDLDSAKKMLSRFQHQFWKKYESNTGSDVYILGLQFFPLVQKWRTPS